jgi:hypothetical protein
LTWVFDGGHNGPGGEHRDPGWVTESKHVPVSIDP